MANRNIQPEPPRLISVPRAAARIDVSERFLHNLIEAGRLRAYSIPGARCTRVRVEDVDQLFVTSDDA
ncbi:helix-turn-helix transcriptional regulator [Rhodococcus aetherivorans]|uniref:helix-turn-helix transcriptional regulator n=1 Tax=Rhodococcus aetherivorans TaxID=191292 RepID=UPI003B8A9ACD